MMNLYDEQAAMRDRHNRKQHELEVQQRRQKELVEKLRALGSRKERNAQLKTLASIEAAKPIPAPALEEFRPYLTVEEATARYKTRQKTSPRPSTKSNVELLQAFNDYAKGLDS